MPYKRIIKPILFSMDPEFVHDMFTTIGVILGSNPVTRAITGMFCNYENKMLNTTVDGIKYRNPVGLAAGFDKNAKLMNIMFDVGFGFEEVGSITARECKGNPRPRLFRLPEDEAIIVNYGLCNQGAEKLSKKLSKVKHKFNIPIGISIAKTNDPSIKSEASVNDYYESYQKLKNLGSYITINISCPNAGDGRCFEDAALLENLLKRIQDHKKPIYLKISPDITEQNLDSTLHLAEKYHVNGFVISNLTHSRNNLKGAHEGKKGSISGRPAKEPSTILIRKVYRKTKGKFTIIGVGGIFTAEDAYEKIKAGASLVQLITGMIFEGPTLIKKINKGLVELLKKDGYKSINEAVGKEQQ